MQLNIDIAIPEQTLINALTAAWEGGIDAWGDHYNPDVTRRPEDSYVTELRFTSPDGEVGGDCDYLMTTTAVGTEQLLAAIARVLNEPELSPGVRLTLLNRLEEVKAGVELDLSDVSNQLVQVACFGQVRYS